MRRLRLSESEQSKPSSSVSWSASRENERSRPSNSSWSAGVWRSVRRSSSVWLGVWRSS